MHIIRCGEPASGRYASRYGSDLAAYGFTSLGINAPTDRDLCRHAFMIAALYDRHRAPARPIGLSRKDLESDD